MRNRLHCAGFDFANTLGRNENRSFKNLCDSDWWELPLLGPGHGWSGPHLSADGAYGDPPPRLAASSPAPPTAPCPSAHPVRASYPQPHCNPQAARGGGDGHQPGRSARGPGGVAARLVQEPRALRKRGAALPGEAPAAPEKDGRGITQAHTMRRVPSGCGAGLVRGSSFLEKKKKK